MNSKLILGLAAMMLSLNACGAPLVNMKVHVYEEGGTPVEGAYVKGSFYQDQVVSQLISDSHRGTTDSEGNVNLSGHEDIYVDLKVNKNGYYVSKQRVVVRGDRGREASVLLRPERDPIAMYAKMVTLKIPERGREYGFDFFKGDLVLPGHKGSQVDVKIKFDRDLVDSNNFTQTVSLSFINPTDGIVEMKTNKAWNASVLKTPYEAVSNGYTKDFKLKYTRGSSGASKSNINMPLFIRLRSSEDKEGNIETAYYCKIFSGIELFGVLADKPSLKMTYYCNPSINDRNLEFNPRKNLFKNLKDEEKVSAP